MRKVILALFVVMIFLGSSVLMISNASGYTPPLSSTLTLPSYIGEGQNFTLYVNDTQPHQVALYVCDFDKIGRKETIELCDLNGHLLTPPCRLSNFEEGKWLRFRFSGSIRIRLIDRSSDSTAVLSALMFDKAL